MCFLCNRNHTEYNLTHVLYFKNGKVHHGILVNMKASNDSGTFLGK